MYSSLTTLGSKKDFTLGVSKTNTFCSLCNKRIREGSECLISENKNFFIHDNCSLYTLELSKSTFLKEVKKRGKKNSRKNNY